MAEKASYAAGGYGGKPGVKVSYDDMARSKSAKSGAQAKQRQAAAAYAKMVAQRLRNIEKSKLDRMHKMEAQQAQDAKDYQKGMDKKAWEQKHAQARIQAGQLKRQREAMGSGMSNLQQQQNYRYKLSQQQYTPQGPMDGSYEAYLASERARSNVQMGMGVNAPTSWSEYMKATQARSAYMQSPYTSQGPGGGAGGSQYYADYNADRLRWEQQQFRQRPGIDWRRDPNWHASAPKGQDLFVDPGVLDPNFPDLPPFPGGPSFGGGYSRGGSSGRIDRWLGDMANWSLLQGF